MQIESDVLFSFGMMLLVAIVAFIIAWRLETKRQAAKQASKRNRSGPQD